MLGKNFSLLFYLKRPKHYTSGAMPVYLRITVDSDVKELCTSRHCDPKTWNRSAEKSMGKSEASKELNNHLSLLKFKAFEARAFLIAHSKTVTAEAVKNKLTGKQEKAKGVLEIFQQHNDQMAALVGRQFAPGTLERYRTALEHAKSFIKFKYDSNDLEITKLDYAFVSEYEFWLKSVRKCNHNSTIKYISNLRKIVLYCIRCGLLGKDPFAEFKMTKLEVERTALSDTELQILKQKPFAVARLQLVCDIFLFSCYTGLAYADVKKLKRTEIRVGIDGRQWIFTHRKKTDTPSHIPLLSAAAELLNKYQESPECVRKGNALPVLSNQNMNAYLKEIGDICGIHKNLTFHIARHTFATTVTLTNGVPIESVSKMLGHKNLYTTQHYAKILDRKVSDDMNELQNRLEHNSSSTF